MGIEENGSIGVVVNLDKDSNEYVEIYQAYVKNKEKKASFNKDQAINRIIKEWANDRNLMLDITKK